MPDIVGKESLEHKGFCVTVLADGVLESYSTVHVVEWLSKSIYTLRASGKAAMRVGDDRIK